ncbi:GTPase required for pre-60S ribosomal subunit nuclear export and maturation, partial [Spiromyces aspiralis]
KKVCNVAPIPGETKVWQYITLMRRIYLIDCPGIVQSSVTDTDEDIVLRGSIRVENLHNPEDYIDAVLSRVRSQYIQRTYNIDHWQDAEEFLTEVAKSMGKLNKGGEPDLHVVAKMVLNDWLRGKLPRYTTPPGYEEPLPNASRGEGEEPAESTGAANDGAEGGDGGVKSERRDKVMIDIKQKFNNIIMATEYLPIDLQGDHEMTESRGEDKDEERTKDADTVAIDTAHAAADDDRDEPDWDEVFQSVAGDVVSSMPSEAGGGKEITNAASPDSELDSDDGDSDGGESDSAESVGPRPRRPVKKAPRMTTNKRKVGTHYYEETNVKNRNRSKKAPENPDQLTKKLRRGGKWKVTSKK